MNYNFPITRDHIDFIKYNSKFTLVERYLSGVTSLLPSILKDITMFSYLFFKLNNKSIRLFPYQDLILNDPHRFKIFRSARQIGKSLALDIKAAYNLIIDHGHEHNECIISKSLPQASFQMSRVKQLLNTMKGVNWKTDKGPQDSMSVITINVSDRYLNRLVVAPCSESALGYDFHEVNLDEIEYWNDVDLHHFYHDIIEPTTYATKGRINTFSNPNGSDNFIADLENIRVNGHKKWHVYVFDFLDRPGNTKSDLDAAKAGKTRQQIESQLLAIRSISSKNYFTPDEIERSYDSNLTILDMVGKQSFFFLDVGAKNDASALIGGYIELDEERSDANGEPIKHFKIPIIHRYPIGYPLSRVVGTDVDDSDGWHYEKSVKDYVKEWSEGGIFPTLGVDCTGNSGIVPLMEMVGLSPIDITFSGPVKSGMYQRFKYLMEKGLIHRIKHSQFEYEASHLEMKKSARGYLMIHHESEDDHDDVMDSVAGFIHVADDPFIVQPSLEIF